MVIVWLTLAMVVVAAGFDLRRHEVPDAIPLLLLVAAVAVAVLGHHPAGWLGLVTGLVLAVAVAVPLFALGAIGGGDVKLLAALGAVLGPLSLLGVLFWTALAGGVLALITWARGGRRFAYVPAIAAGLLVQCVWPTGVGDVLFR